ncbi:hypothetical protein HID58_066572 [Brassica napus]|uniref:Replication protein A 70 kDa DNA-binding subunit B/D first OB fold domain-containing protein n=1 Tax=Brassica napus TaxID=3708 RepID=A0ABQ7ZGB2_BRANA|nr:hypothetical protein HID58_066572 [Brassica napus]
MAISSIKYKNITLVITSQKKSLYKFCAMGSHTVLAELSLLKPLLPIRVKEKTEVGSRFQKLELIIGDEKGTTIQATFFRDLDASTEMSLEEGHCYEIKNSVLMPPSECIRLTKNRYHINLNNSSVILKIDPFSNNVVIKCVAYGTLAHVFQDLWNSTNANVVLYVLQFW